MIQPLRTIARGALGGALCFWLATTATAAAVAFPVGHVIDGDTLVLQDGRHVRLLGINTPELGHDGTPDEPLARAARAALVAFIDAGPVQLRVGRDARDRHGRLLAQVFRADGADAQAYLLRRGLAFQIAIPPNLNDLRRYRTAEAAARRRGLGVWGEDYYRPVDAGRFDGRTGFRRVRGRVQALGGSRRSIYLELSSRVAVRIKRADLHYFDELPEAYLGREIVARGWVSGFKGRYYINVGHPVMLESATPPPGAAGDAGHDYATGAHQHVLAGLEHP